ncbi:MULTISPECIES: DNA adenine methylase [Halomonas]|uniref:DNA adenine methylase n=1 Tax=Halomonas TaxID=2745 RepID=UPI001C97023E|nr:MULTISPECIES: DNA adenine methylase [Halomonas]MBY6207476.1 DNA adenine methylase [Halomonas sp. DP3Y7-2]MBY6228285.1 DNA adenine methylase [Halomonas sp. DP3Y7-1]
MTEQLEFECVEPKAKVAPGLSEGSTPMLCRKAESKKNVFRSIHYLGSKQRLLPAIREAVTQIAPESSRMIDLFSGSGIVSHEFSSDRPVTAVDIQEYSRVLSSTMLNGPIESDLDITQIPYLIQSSEITKKLLWAFEPLISIEEEVIKNSALGNLNDLCFLLENACFLEYQLGLNNPDHFEFRAALEKTEQRLALADLLESKRSVVTRYYGGIYFSYMQAVYIDATRTIISNHFPSYDLPIAALLSTASDISNTVGNQFAQPLRPRDKEGRPKASLSKKVKTDRERSVVDTLAKWLVKYSKIGKPAFKHKTVRADFIEALQKTTDEIGVIYADPPYTRDHYSRFYHVLETIALQDRPSIVRFSTSPNSRFSRGIYRDDRHQSPFCIRSTAPDAFRSLFSLSQKLSAPLVLSYSPYEATDGTHPRVVSRSQLVNIASEFFENVDCIELDNFNHSMLNKSDSKLKTRAQSEILLICR